MDVNIKCPYCEQKNEFYIESEYYEDWWAYEHECEECHQIFWTIMNMSWWSSGEAIKLPCANWEWHDFSTIRYYWDYTTKACSECWAEEHPYSEFLKNKN